MPRRKIPYVSELNSILAKKGAGGGDEYEVLHDYEAEPVEGADEEDDLILEPGDKVVVLKQSKDDPSMLLVQSLDEPTKMGYVPNSILKKIPAPVRATAVVPAAGQTLSKKDAKFNRDVVLAELVETEEEFGQDIQEVVDRYFNPLETNGAPRIVRDNKDLIFNNLKQISQFHNTVLISGLKYAASEPKTMGRTFLRLERDFDKHVNYCQTEPDAQDFLECNYEVHEYFEDERLKCADEKSLSEHLKLPIQRINDYQLLLKELVKYSLLIGEDTTDLERALELMLSIPHRFTDTKFLTNIEGFHGTIHKLGRLLKHGWYYVQDAEDPKGHQRYCFLFKSRILVCKVRRISEDRSVFVLKDIIRLPEVTVKAAPDNKRVWVLHHRQGEVGNYPFTFRANEDVSRDQWITEIDEHRNDLREKEDLQEQFWEQEYVSITKTTKSSITQTTKSSISETANTSLTVTNIEHNSDDLKVQKQPDEDLFEPLKGIELDISSEIEEGLDPIERRLAPKPLKHVEEPKRPPLTLPPKEPIFECTSPPPESKKQPEPEVIKVEEPPVVEKLVDPPKEVIVENEINEVPIPEVHPVPVEPPPPERSPSPVEEVIEAEPMKYIEGVSKPYFHVNIKGTSHGVGENAIFECEIEGATKVTWLKNNLPLPSTITQRTTITEDKENNLYKLQLNKVIMSDSGTYTVKAENDIGESTSTAHLFVENLSADEKKARAKANAPIFAVKLSDTQLLENTHARFIIEIKGNPMPKLRFFKGDNEISMDDKRVQISEVNKDKGLYELILPDVKPEDAGEYRVVASNKYSEESCSCQVSVTNEKDLWAGMHPEVPDGAPVFTWLKNGRPFNPEERFKVLFKDDEDSLALVFQNVKPEDAGLYTCIASTCHGKISCSAELSVQGVVKELNLPYAPRIMVENKELETKIQSTAILEVKVIGDPQPDITWFNSEGEIKENERIKVMFEDDIASLVIKNVEVEDEGDYKIVAKNDLGSDTETISLLIKAAPRFRKNLIDYEGVTGKDITLTVEIEASPKPIVQWYKDSKVIKKSNRIKYVTDEVSGSYTLIIEDCKMEDVGLYSVVASNQFSQISDACRINLQMPPQFIGALAKEVETLEGDYVSLSVRVEGDPPPEVKWYFEDQLLVSDKNHIKINAVDDVHTLLISNLTRNDSGKYTCEISNEFGKNTSEGKLFVKCPPIFETPLTDTKAVEGDTNVEFFVKLNSYPKSSVKWFREEEEITETTTEFTCIEDGDNYKLIIKEAKTKLAGTYKCRATNEIGTYDSEATLTVMSQPTFKKGLRDMEVTEGGMLKLQVTCFGSPIPDIKWYKDGKEVRSDAHIKISKDTKRVENFSLTVNLVKVEDGGEYEVRATNEMGTAVTKSIVNILAKHSTDIKDDDDESIKETNEDTQKDTNETEKVILPINNKNKESTREKLVEINVNEARKLGIASINNIDGDQSTKTEESLIIMSSQSGEFSCVEMHWEESSVKSKNYYGVVEEPKEERIIPIKIDRGISIHTASDEEEEPFWVVESVKKHEEIRNEIQKMKTEKKSQASLGDYDEDDDSSLNELLRRVKKQRNDLGDILEKENNNSSSFAVNHTEKIPSRSNSVISEASTLKEESISRISSLDENIKDNKTTDNAYESVSIIPKTHIETKNESLSISENISNMIITSSIESIDGPKKSSIIESLSTDAIEKKSSFYIENENSTYSKYEDTVLNTVKRATVLKSSSENEYDDLLMTKKSINEHSEKSKRGSLSRLSSTEERDNLSTSTKVSVNENSERPKRGSLSRLSSTEERVDLSTSTKVSVNENSERPKRGSLSRLSSTEERDDLSTSTKVSINENSERPKRGSLSRLSSIEERDNSSTLTKVSANEYSERSKRGSLSRLSSTEERDNLSTSTKVSVNENSERPKRGSLSRLSSIEERDNSFTLTKVAANEYSERSKRGSLSRLSFTEERDNLSTSTKVSVNENSERPKRGSLSRISSTEERDNLSTSTKVSVNEYSERSKRGSLSRLSSTEERDNSSTPTKVAVNEYFARPKRGSLSRLSSTEDRDNLSTSTNVSVNENSERPKRGSLSRLSSTEERDNSSTLTKVAANEYSERSKRGSLSRLSSTEERDNSSTPTKVAVNEYSARPKRGSLSRLSSTEERDNLSTSTKVSVNENSEKPKRGSLSRISSTEERDNLSTSTKVSVNEYSERSKRGSLSRLSSTEERDNSSTPTKVAVNEYSARPKRGSLSRLSSTEIRDDSPISTKVAVNEYSERPKRGSLSRLSSTEERNNSTSITNVTSTECFDGSKRGSLSILTSIDEHLNSSATKLVELKKESLENNPILKSTSPEVIDEADYRRKSLIKESGLLSDALSAMCTDVHEESKFTKDKRLSIIGDDKEGKNIDNTPTQINEDNLLKTSIKQRNSIKSLSFDEKEVDGSSIKESIISKNTHDENILNLENVEIKLTNETDGGKKSSELNKELNPIDAQNTQTVSLKKLFANNKENLETNVQVSKQLSVDHINKEDEKIVEIISKDKDKKSTNGIKQIGVPPKIISGMDDVETYETLTQVFDVKARGAPKPKVQWFKDGEELSNTRNIQISDSNETESFKLTLIDLRVANSGSYCCKLTNEVGEDMQSSKLDVQDVELLRGPKIKKPLSDLEVTKGQKVVWSIKLIADPIPEVEWTCDGKKVNADFTTDSSEIANGLKDCTFTMTIPTSELSDTGVYRVKATNKFDSAECSARLDIIMKPEIEGFHDVTVIPSMEAVFEAIIKAVPKPKIVWTVNGKDLSERECVNLTSEEMEQDITKFKIVIGNVNPEEEGEYAVKAWNKVGETTAVANLKLHTEPPSFVKLMEDKTIQEYEEVKLTVRANGIPKPKITWFKNGEVVIPDLRISVHTTEEGQTKSTLTIDHFSNLDIANFSVKAVNMIGEAETSSNLKMAEIMPSFVKPFERITEAVEGSPIELQTQLIGSPRPDVKCYKDGEELKNKEGENTDDQPQHITLEANPNGTILMKIDNVEQADCGAYKIIATNNFGTSATNTALVVTEIPKKPIIIKHPKQVDTVEGETLKIEAQYVAYPEAIVKWYKDGHVLHPCPQLDFVLGPNGNIALVIEKATIEDAGDYEVVVSNDLGKASGQVEVTVKPAATEPAFITPLRDSKVVEGFPAKLQIKLSGYPLPEIAWTINDKPLVVDGEKVKMAHEPNGIHYLLIEKAGPEHAGKLAVIATNENGKTKSEATLSVTPKISSESSETKPVFLNGLKDTTIEESNNLSLLAPFLGNPIPDVKWEKDGKILQPCNKTHFTCDGYKVGLEVLDTNIGDAGLYTCTLTNKLGSAKSDCQVGIRKLYQAPVFTQRFSHNQQLLSRDAKFHARVTGVPSPNVIWHKNGHQLTNGDKYKIKRDGEVCSLTIRDVDNNDAGLYSCIATNRDGTATCEAQLSIAPRINDESKKQEPPSFLKKIGDSEVFDGMTAKFTACATGWPEPEYEWFLDTNRLYETERIRMEKEGSGLLRLKILHADPLIDAGRYKLRIYNPHGEAYCEASIIFDNGLDSRSKRPVGELYKDFDRYRATGAPLPLPDPPTISRMTDKRLTLSWKPSLPISPRTPVTYLVEMEEQPKGEWSTVRAGIRGCACDIHNLIPFRDYKFRVRVENNFGISDPSPFVLTFREKLEPEPPKFTPYLPPGTDFKPESSIYFPKDFDIERPPHDNYAQAPRFLHQEHDTQYGVKGHNANLYWFVYGYPKPKMQFYFDNELIEMGGRYDSSYTRNGQATLFINKMLDRDIGTYEAVATNEHGTARQRVRLQIAEYPKFLKRPEEMYVTLRKNCKLEARVIGVPYPEIKWFKDWKPMVDSTRIQIEQVEPDVCILRIEDIIMKDEGLYSISARNLAGSVSTSVAIHVEDRESDYSYNGKTDIKWKKKELSELYDIGDELGRGTQGVVYHAVERSTGRSYAAKIMHAKGDHLTRLMDNELRIMSDLSNRRIIRIHDALQTTRTYTLITELAGGGELLDTLTKHSFLTEYDVALYIIQLLKSLKYMHDFEIAHLGLTPGDLLISHPGGDTLKLCDFGLSRKINRRKLEPVDYGMPEFISPEIAKGEGVDLSSDMWSVGVITHLLLTGVSLFRCVNDADTLDRVKSGSYTLSTKISDLARDFITKLLVFSPNDRLDVINALKHPWLQFGEDIPTDTSRINTDSLRNYYNNFKDWYSNASCRNWYRRRPLSSAYTQPSKMIYPPGFACTPSPTPEPEPKKPTKHVPSWKDKLPPKEPIDTEIGIIKSESHYQYGPDTYLLQLRDTNFPVRLREYMKVAGKSLTHRGGSESHMDWEAPVIRERRRFTDIMDEEIEDEQKARISQYGADIYTLRRLKQEIGSRPTAHVEAEAILESRIDGQPPFFREKPQKLPIEPDKPADLMCLAVGIPKPLVQWFKNDIVLTESHRIKMLEDNDGRSILRLDPATELDLGIYKVVARNKFGQTTARARLVLAHEPGPMEAPIVKEFSDTEILLRWDHPKLDGNASILCYQLEVRENESEWDLVAKNIDHEFWLMQNLRPYTNYEFRLAAMNHIGWGPVGPSSPMVRTHFPDAQKLEVPSAMLNLQIITESGREIIGDEPRNSLDYSLEYKPTDWVEQPPIEKYRFISEIARGRFSVILKGINTSNDSIIVAKLTEITPETEVQVNHEFNVLKSLKHERIAHLIEAFKLENAPVAVFIQEKLQGADILTYLSTKEHYSEQTVATIVTQVLDGLQYLHWRGYAHLDLQPDNIVMASVRTIQVKLIDFGSAHKVSKLGAVVGTNNVLEFTAPEILCDEPAYPYSDIWSLGVIAYTLLSGMSPFRGGNDIETRQNITFVRYRFEYLYKDLSQEATRFLMLLFKRTPTKRPSAEECHEHRWLLPTEYMIKKREKTMFSSFKLQQFAKEYHENRTKLATSSPKLLGALGTRQVGLGRSNSVVDELLIFK